MSDDETETRTLEDLSFGTFSTAKHALEECAELAEDGETAARCEDSIAELAEKWNEANERTDDD